MFRPGEIVAPARDVSVAIPGGAGRHGFSHRLRLQLPAGPAAAETQVRWQRRSSDLRGSSRVLLRRPQSYVGFRDRVQRADSRITLSFASLVRLSSDRAACRLLSPPSSSWRWQPASRSPKAPFSPANSAGAGQVCSPLTPPRTSNSPVPAAPLDRFASTGRGWRMPPASCSIPGLLTSHGRSTSRCG